MASLMPAPKLLYADKLGLAPTVSGPIEETMNSENNLFIIATGKKSK